MIDFYQTKLDLNKLVVQNFFLSVGHVSNILFHNEGLVLISYVYSINFVFSLGKQR